MHDGIEIYSNDDVISTIVTCIKDYSFKTINKEVCKGDIVWIGDISKNVESNSVIYKTSSFKLNKKYSDKINKSIKKTIVKGAINILKNNNINMDVVLNNEIINVAIEYIPETSIKKSVDPDYVYNQISKTLESSFEFDLKYNIDDKLFVPLSKLNELRRKVILKLEKCYKVKIDVTDCYNRLNEYILKHDKLVNESNVTQTKTNSLFIYNYDILKANEYISDVIYINISDILKYEKSNIDILSKHTNIYIYIPNIVLNNLDKYINNNLERLVKLDNVDGILLGNIGYIDDVIEMKNKYNIQIVLDYSLNITNTYSCLFYKNLGVDKITISPEISNEKINCISKLLQVELINNYVTVMTSRFCLIKSFGRCSDGTYKIKDNYNNISYDIICDSSDCVIKLVKKIDNKNGSRKCVI